MLNLNKTLLMILLMYILERIKVLSSEKYIVIQ